MVTTSRFLLAAIVAASFAQRSAAQGRTPTGPVMDPTGVGDTSMFAPLDLVRGNMYRSGSGVPGPKYWQQHADYDLHGTLDTATKSLKGEMTLRYTNNSPDTLRFVWFQVEQNAFKSGSLNSFVFPSESRFGARNFEGGDVIDRFNQVIAGKKTAVKMRVEGTIMKVDLVTPLPPGQSTTFDAAWHFNIPEHGADRMGYDGALFELAQWYPRLCVYDDLRGWNTVTPMFGRENYHVVDGIARENPHTVNGKQVEVVYDDGRHFLRTSQEKFDIITSDPIDPWVKGCAALNTVEYYQMCRDHLNPGGSVCLWIPLYESNLETTKSVIATFFQVFPQGILWSNDRGGYGYDAVLFGQVEPTVIDVDELQRRLDRPDHQLVKQSLRDVGFGEPRTGTDGAMVREEAIDLLATYSGQAPFLKEWSQGAQLNTDRNLRLQYLAGMWLNSNMGVKILSTILAYYRFPDRTFVGSPAAIHALEQALARGGRIASPVLARDQTRP